MPENIGGFPEYEPQPRDSLEVVFNLIDGHFEQASRIQSQISAGRGAYLATDSISLESIGLQTVSKRILLDYPYRASKGRYGEAADLDATSYPRVLERIRNRPLHLFKPEISDLFDDVELPKLYFASFASPKDEDGKHDLFFIFDRDNGIEPLPTDEMARIDTVAEQTSRYIAQMTEPYKERGLSKDASGVVEFDLQAAYRTDELVAMIDEDTLHRFWINNLKSRQLTPVSH